MNDQTVPHAGAEASRELDPDVRERLAGAARSRSDIYRGLAIGFSEPDEDLRAALAAGTLVERLTAASGWLGADARLYAAALQTLADAEFDCLPLVDLGAEYARLFTGPGRAAVARFAGQYLDEPGPDGRRRLHGHTTEAVLTSYEAEGLAPAHGLHEPGDDIATELEFLAWLCSREERNWIDGTSEEALRLRRSSDRFLREQCAGWWPEFAEAVLEQAAASAYRGFAQLLAAHLAVELGFPRAAPPGPGRGVGA